MEVTVLRVIAISSESVISRIETSCHNDAVGLGVDPTPDRTLAGPTRGSAIESLVVARA